MLWPQLSPVPALKQPDQAHQVEVLVAMHAANTGLKLALLVVPGHPPEAGLAPAVEQQDSLSAPLPCTLPSLQSTIQLTPCSTC